MKELLIPTFNFSILVGLLGYFTWPVFKKFVAERRELLKDKIDTSRTQKVAAEKKYREIETKLKEFETEAEQNLQKALAEAEEMKKRLVANAQKQAEAIVRDADSLALANMNDFRNDLRKKTIEIAVEEAEKLIRSRLSKEIEKRIISNYVEKVQ